MHEVSEIAKRNAMDYREPLSSDMSVREFANWEKQRSIKSRRRYIGPIAAGYFRTTGGHHAVPEDASSGEREVRIDLRNGSNSEIVRIPQAFPIYEYEIDASYHDGFADCLRIKRRSLPPTFQNVEWILRYVLEYNREVLESIFERTTGKGFGTQDMFLKADATHVEVYDFIRSTLERNTRLIFEQTNHKKAPGDLAETFEQYIIRNSERRTENSDGQKKRPLDFILFASHPESIRYFGAETFTELADIYDESWLMGLSLESLEKLHAVAYKNPYDICFPHTMPRYICSKRHVYISRLEFNSRISECSLGSFLSICKNRRIFYDPSAYAELAVYHALKYHVAIGNHSYCDVATLSSMVNFHHSGLFAQRFYSTFDNCPNDSFSPEKIMAALDRLMRVEAIYVHCPVGDFVELRAADKDIGMRKDLMIYLRVVYEAEAMLVSSLYQVYKRHHNARMCGIPLTDRTLDPEALQNICSEQRFLIENLERLPVINVFGPGGAGKTYALMLLEKLFGDKICYFGWQNRHVNNLARLFKGRCSTIHKALVRHPYYCQKTINDFTNEAGVYQTLMGILRARQSSSDLNGAVKSEAADEDEDDDGGIEARVWACPHISCPFENLTVACFEEVSTISLHLCAVILALLLRCAPNLRLVIFAGDHRQLPSMSFGNLIHDLSKGLGIFEFKHTHRSRALSLRLNAELLAQDDRPLEFDVPIVNEKEPHVLLEPAFKERESLLSTIGSLIKRRRLTSTNSQFVTRTHEVRRMCGNYIRNALLGLGEDVRGGIFQGQKIMFSHGSLGSIGTGEIRVAWCVVHVQLIAVANRQPSVLSEQFAKTSEIVSASLMIDPRDGDQPQNVGEIIDRVADAQLQLPDALELLVNTKKNRRKLLESHCIPLHPDLMRILRNNLTKKAKENIGGLVDLRCLHARFVEASYNTIQQAGSLGAANGYTQRIIACFPVDSPHAHSLPEISFDNLKQLVIDGHVQFMPYTGAERSSVVDASIVTVSAMQGSSAPTVVDIKLCPSRYDYKSCLYTAVTRPEDYYIGLGDPDAFKQAARRPDPERKSNLCNTLATLHAAFAPTLAPLEYRGAAMLELHESRDAGCKYFAYLSCHPKPFVRAYARQAGLSDKKLKPVLARLDEMLEDDSQHWREIHVQKSAPATSAMKLERTAPTSGTADYFDDLDDSLFDTLQAPSAPPAPPAARPIGQHYLAVMETVYGALV